MSAAKQPLLQIGAVGTAVRYLQTLLNQLPTQLETLAVDGLFGSKTRQRVKEFQGQNQLSQDGVAGPFTWEKLLELINRHGPAVVEAFIPPAGEMAARETIAAVANDQAAIFGGFDPKLHMGSAKIAGSLCANPATRARQGGLQLAAIFTVAGAASAAKCPSITVKAEQMYQRPHTSEERNQTDLPSWCGIFALYCCKMAGLRLSPWPLRWTPGKPKDSDEFRLLLPGEQPMKGDLGIKMMVGGKKLNHHFVIVDSTGKSVSTVDGNAGAYQQIVSRGYTTVEIYQSNGGFLRPIWERVLPGSKP
ncbi:MAG: peptidoglycan-binding protein [Bryobacterales bacterium]|nr:peptidoglycan-binding protein [Bryobacterales bacterium]